MPFITLFPLAVTRLNAPQVEGNNLIAGGQLQPSLSCHEQTIKYTQVWKHS